MKKKILLTFGRSPLATDLSRQLAYAGHEVYIAESTRFHVTGFSNSVIKSYKVSSPRQDRNLFVQDILEVINKEKIDLVIPLYEEGYFLSQARTLFPKFCTLLCPDPETFDTLHNKWKFHELLNRLSIPTLECVLINSSESLKQFKTPFALKTCYTRASQTIKKITNAEMLGPLKHDPNNPWIAQEWGEGARYCSYSICQEGEIKAHSVYPVKFAINGTSCVYFESIEHPKILEWIKKLCKELGYTGQIAFDFIENERLYAIECNPRATSGLHLFENTDQLSLAFLNKNTSPIFPKKGASQQIAIGMLVWGWRKNAMVGNSLRRFVEKFFSTKDVIYSRYDLKPILIQPFVFVSLWIQGILKNLPVQNFFIYDHEWNGENALKNFKADNRANQINQKEKLPET